MAKCDVDAANGTAWRAQAKKLKGSWALCSGEDAQECPAGKYGNTTTELFPDPIPVDANFTVIGVGNSFEDIKSPSFSLRVADGTLIDTTVKDEGCGPHKYIFPLGNGALYYDGLSCPVRAGPLNVSFTAEVSSLGWHTEDGTGLVTLKIYDEPEQQGNCVWCTVTTLKMTG